MLFEVLASDDFARDLKALAKKYPGIKRDISELTKQLISNPFQGQPIGKGCFKIRISITGKSKGKRGGGCIIAFVAITEEKVILIAIYDKSETTNLSDALIRQRLDSI